ncbi:16S rRNA (adenine(1518)-N(6)/adenine(1519)-N(6))-dimethyltransferase RsmA [Thermodesulfobacteriota bacterium]
MSGTDGHPASRAIGARGTRVALRKLGIRPSRRLGQSFLVDESIPAKIAALAAPRPGQTVLEIGPGLGCLTFALASAGCRVLACELDGRLAGYLQEVTAGLPGVEVLRGDILGIDLRDLAEGSDGKLKVAANLPYQIATEVMFRLIDDRELFETFTLMFQKEMADRIVAPPGTRDSGVLSVRATMVLDITREIEVPRSAFHPQPKVDSTVLQFQVLDEPRFIVGDERFFAMAVKAAFSHRRKTLSNSLASSGWLRCPAREIAAALEQAGIDPKRRAETLDLEEFARMTECLLRLRG